MTVRNTGRVALLIGLLGSLLIVAPLEAQRGRPGGGRRGQGPDRAELEQRIRERMAVMMKEQLGLTDEQSEALSQAVRSSDEERRTLARQEQALRRRAEALMLEGGDDDVEATELMARMLELRQQEVDLFRVEQERLLEILDPAQVLHYQLLREQLGDRIRRFRGGRGGPGQGMMPDSGYARGNFGFRDPGFPER